MRRTYAEIQAAPTVRVARAGLERRVKQRERQKRWANMLRILRGFWRTP